VGASDPRGPRPGQDDPERMQEVIETVTRLQVEAEKKDASRVDSKVPTGRGGGAADRQRSEVATPSLIKVHPPCLFCAREEFRTPPKTVQIEVHTPFSGKLMGKRQNFF